MPEEAPSEIQDREGTQHDKIKIELIGKLVGILLIVLIITSAFSGAVFAPERK